MGLRIQTNVAAMNTHRQLSISDTAMSKSLERLSSGYRINRAADDAAGLAISRASRGRAGPSNQGRHPGDTARGYVQAQRGDRPPKDRECSPEDHRWGSLLTALETLANAAKAAIGLRTVAKT